ncbi:MAG TPA: fused MFS/spermidine synthase [Thermoanaerobaculia bacterium]|nr:fused MFS/spermidine synthase [Thermoanaerobaculia bacterium]
MPTSALPSPAPIATSLRSNAVVALSGGVLMALEILALRILSPSFGSSVYVWGAVLSVFLAAMSTGYVIGGRLADRRPELEVLGTLLLISSLGIAALIGTSFALAEQIASWAEARTWGPLVAATLLFGPATALLASASPFAVRLAAHELAGVGRIAGRLYAISTVGSLAGTLVATFLLIPFLELDSILLLLTAGAITAGAIASGRSITRRPASAAMLILAVAVTGIGWAGARRATPGALLERRLSPYQTLDVIESAGRRTLLSNGHRQASIELATGEPALRYARAARVALLYHPQPRRALFLGLGGGSVAHVLRELVPALEADHVEIDAAVLDLAERHFGFARGPGDRVHLDDGRRFLRRTGETWDLIVVDTYVGLSIPFHLATREMYQLVERRLDPGGVLLLNLAAPPDQPLVAAILDTVRSVFPAVSVYAVPGASGTLVVARGLAPEADPITSDQLAERARRFDERFDLDPSFAQLLEARIETPDGATETILHDAFAPVDRLLHLGRAAPRVPG